MREAEERSEPTDEQKLNLSPSAPYQRYSQPGPFQFGSEVRGAAER